MNEGEVDIKLFDKQIQAFECLSEEDRVINELLYGGGARGGKSYLGCVWQLIRRITLPGSAGLIAREELTKLKDTTLITFFKVANAYGLRDLFTFDAQSLKATFSNGSLIFFREIKYIPSDPEFDRLGSYDFTDAFIDEAQQISSKAISVLRGRFSLLRGKREDGTGWYTIPKILYTCNPKRNWIYKDFVQPAQKGTIRKDRVFIKALPVDNPYTDQAYIDNLLKADKVTVQRLYYGNFEYDDDPSSLCDYDAISDIFCNDFIEERGESYISADIAMKGRDRFVVGSWKGMVCKISVDKTYSEATEIESDLKSVMIQSRVARSRTIVDSDGLGSYLESYLKGIKEFHGGGKAFSDEYLNLKSECAFKLAELINNRLIKVVCTSEQRERIEEEIAQLKQDKIDDDTSKKRIIKKEVIKQNLQRSPDYLDMLIMKMYFEVCKNKNNETNLNFYDSDIDITKGDIYIEINPCINGKFVAVFCSVKDSDIYVYDTIFSDTLIEPSVIINKLKGVKANIQMECDKGYISYFNELKNGLEYVHARPSLINKTAMIEAHLNFIHEHFYFKRDYNSKIDYSLFVENLLDFRNDENIEAVNSLSHIAERIKRCRA